MTAKTYPAQAHATKVVEELIKLLPEAEKAKKHAIFLQGTPISCRDDTDRELPFHQEANFIYLSGCHIPSSSLCLTSVGSSPSQISHHLFIPAADPLETMWSVAPPSLEEARRTLDTPLLDHTSALEGLMGRLEKEEISFHTLPITMEYPALPEGVKAVLELPKDSGCTIRHSTQYLLDALHIARLKKDREEVELIREANRIGSAAHEVVMRELGRFAGTRKGGSGQSKERSGKEGVLEWEVEGEGDAEALFVATCRRMGAAQAYLPIVASGTRASTLHYVCNDRLFPSTSTPRANGDTSFTPRPLVRGCCGSIPEHDHSQPPSKHHDSAFYPQVLLIDAGAEWQGYASDITRTIPLGNGGRFTPRAADIYDLVLRMQKASLECQAMVKPGVHWDTLHLHGHKVLIDVFLELGVFNGDPEEILQSGITAGFYPHGLGHSMGLDVHDSRQHLKSVHNDLPAESSKTPAKLYNYLRIRRPLEEGMVLTIEPGCYFPPQLMEEHGIWDSPYVNTERLREYVPVGGVRLEDDVVVTENGCENLTTVGREREWLEKVCSGEA